jgi:hypothetical protein
MSDVEGEDSPLMRTVSRQPLSDACTPEHLLASWDGRAVAAFVRGDSSIG